MQMRTLGRTGVQVSPLCLGAMMFGAWGNTDHDESVRIIHAALDAGINVIDTADVYCGGGVRGDRRQGAGRGRREHVVLATKAHGPMGEDPNQRGNSRRWLVREVEASLRRLQTDHIDLYQIHRPSPDTDVEETLDALTDLQRAGKIRYFGSSTFPASQVVQAQWAAERRHSRALRHRAAAVLACSCAASRPRCCRCARSTGWACCRGARWPAGGCRASGAGSGPRRTHVDAGRPDARRGTTCRYPVNQAKLDAADALAGARRAGRDDLPHLAIAFVLAAPGGVHRDHRAADDGAAGVAARRGGRRAHRRRAGRGSTRSCRRGRTSRRRTPGTRRRR